MSQKLNVLGEGTVNFSELYVQHFPREFANSNILNLPSEEPTTHAQFAGLSSSSISIRTSMFLYLIYGEGGPIHNMQDQLPAVLLGSPFDVKEDPEHGAVTSLLPPSGP